MRNNNRSSGRYKIRQADGVVTQCSSRLTKNDRHAHSFYIGKLRFSIFSDDDLSPVIAGDRVRFDYEIRRLKSGYRNEYYSVIPESLAIDAPHQLEANIEGQVYILSNASMPGILKIGYTSGSATKRASELSGVTSIPTGFKVEWSLPIIGDPRAVEQRAHAHLSKKRHGKEFFKVSLSEAKSACIQSFAEIYPERAANMEEAFAARANIEIQRRDELKKLKIKQEEERKKETEQRVFEASREGRWLKEGKCKVTLHDYLSSPNTGTPSLLSKLLCIKFEDYLDINITAVQNRDIIQWQFTISGRIEKKSFWKSYTLASLDDCITQISLLIESNKVVNYQSNIVIPNILIEKPPGLPQEYRNPSAILPIKNLDGLLLRPAPIVKNIRHRKFN